MILERLRIGVQRQDWFAVGLEVVIVVLGVVIGFQVTDWGEERADRAEEQELLRGLTTEFADVLSDVERQIDKHKRIERDIAAVLGAIGSARSAGQASVAIPDTTLAWALVATTTQFSQGVLDGTLSTGRLELIRDRELRTALSEWDGVMADVTEDEVTSREIVVTLIDPILWRVMDVRTARSYDVLGTLPAEAAGTSSNVPVNAELTGALATRLYWQRHTIAEFAGPQAEARRILALLERSLDGGP